MSTKLKTLIAIIFFVAFSQQYSTAQVDPPRNPTDATKNYNKNIYTQSGLNFYDKSDSLASIRGKLAMWPTLQIKNGKNEIWDMAKFSFLNDYPTTAAPSSVNPSLWRQAKLNYTPGVFQVTDSIYQVRGFDLSNVTFVMGKTGWIVIDPLVTQGSARAALDSINSVVNPLNKKVSAIIYTHSHIDHYGGIMGVIDAANSKNIPIYGPSGFLEHAVSENTIAGNVMGRRAAYMYGSLYPRGEKYMVDAGLGKGLSNDTSGILANTVNIDAPITSPFKIKIDGMWVYFWCTPDAEAPSEMMFYFPTQQSICASEEVCHTMHNVYSLRGAKVRDALKWSKYIDSTLMFYGASATSMFASHHWPVTGNDTVKALLTTQRDLYRYMHDQTMRLANQGLTANAIAQLVKLPKSLDTVWANRGYYGTLIHNTKSIFDFYLGGWFDGNPAHLNPLAPQDESKKYVEFMGGRDSTYSKALRSYDKGEYRWAATVLNHLVFSDSSDMKARLLLAATYDQLGYQSESGPWRNFYLTGAQELRFNNLAYKKENVYPTREVMEQMPADQYFDFMAIHLVPERVNDKKKYSFSIKFNDTKKFPFMVYLYVENSTMNYRIIPNTNPTEAIHTDAIIVLPRHVMDSIIISGPIIGQRAMDRALSNGTAQISGDKYKWNEFIAFFEEFQFWFNIVLPPRKKY